MTAREWSRPEHAGENPKPMHTIDELAEVRRKRALLERREKVLIDRVKALGLGTHVGDDYLAVVHRRERTALDQAGLKAEVPDRVWQPYMKTTDYVVVDTHIKDNDNGRSKEV